MVDNGDNDDKNIPTTINRQHIQRTMKTYHIGICVQPHTKQQQLAVHPEDKINQDKKSCHIYNTLPHAVPHIMEKRDSHLAHKQNVRRRHLEGAHKPKKEKQRRKT